MECVGPQYLYKTFPDAHFQCFLCGDTVIRNLWQYLIGLDVHKTQKMRNTNTSIIMETQKEDQLGGSGEKVQGIISSCEMR